MAEQEWDGADVGAGFEQVNGEAVSQRVGREGLGPAGAAQDFRAEIATAIDLGAVFLLWFPY